MSFLYIFKVDCKDCFCQRKISIVFIISKKSGKSTFVSNHVKSNPRGHRQIMYNLTLKGGLDYELGIQDELLKKHLSTVS